MIIRPARLPEDSEDIAGIDTSFTSDRIYRVERDGLGFRLQEEPVSPPIEKAYPIMLGARTSVFVAEDAGEIVGLAEGELLSWHGRAEIANIYVSSPYRARGIGRSLVETLNSWARSQGAQCLWVGTQNVNVPAVRFYERLGFRLCGLDIALHDMTAIPGEVALFFSRAVEGPRSPGVA
jgi:ribosomal protein S18 acetylase RimI-like enzyme